MAIKVQGAIRLSDVCFSYVDGSTALSGISFGVNAGERVAIVGPTGSGKSTIAKLLVRLYSLKRGEIAIDGTDIRTVTVRELRSKIALLPQHPVLFDGNVRDNLLLAKPSASIGELKLVLEIAQLRQSNKIDVLDSLCSELSGGERQRVALARALLQQRPILVMDEATSALDPSTEAAFLDALAQSFPRTTMLAISHREAITRWATQVLVINSGKVVGQGSHSKMMRENLFYRSLWLRNSLQTSQSTQTSRGNAHATEW
jgi:ATP-binding cassette subfamily B protein